MSTSLGRIIVQVNGMKCLWADTISLTVNVKSVMQKYFRYLVKEFTHNPFLVVIPFIWRSLRLITLINWNHQPHLWQNFILIYMVKVLRILELMQHIFVSSSIPSLKMFNRLGLAQDVTYFLIFGIFFENHVFIVGIGPILSKELEFIYQSDRTYVHSQV